MSVLDTYAVDSSARGVQKIGDPKQAGFIVERCWPQLHAAYADTVFLAKKRDRKVISPVTDKKTDSGQFIVSHVGFAEGADNDAAKRHPVVSQRLTKFKPVTDTGIQTTVFTPLTRKEALSLFAINEGVQLYWQAVPVLG